MQINSGSTNFIPMRTSAEQFRTDYVGQYVLLYVSRCYQIIYTEWITLNRRYLLWKKPVWQSCKNVDAYQTWSWQLIYNILKIVTENKPNYYKLKMVLLFLREILDIIYVVVCHIAVSKIISQRALLLYWFRFFVMLRAVSWIQHFVRLIHK